jgi:hypothetical protein
MVLHMTDQMREWQQTTCGLGSSVRGEEAKRGKPRCLATVYYILL